MVTHIPSSHTIYFLLLDLHYAGHYKMSLRGGAWQCEAVLALRPSGKSLSTELWILLASWRVTLRKFVASTMRTCLLTARALALALVSSGVLLVCVGLPPSLQLTTIPVSSRPWPRLRLRLEGG